MFDQPADFSAESDALYEILALLDGAAFDCASQFKGWSINDVLGHLYMWNWAADAGLHDVDAFDAVSRQLTLAMGEGKPIRAFEQQWRQGLAGHELLDAWHNFYPAMAQRFSVADPKARVKWFGPDMSVRSSITARLMETWAHGQAIYDMLGIRRVDADRVKNIAVLAINTFGWSFSNRGLAVPDAVPYIRLTAPSDELWQWSDETPDNMIEGSATEFCQVATQVRNIADTKLRVVGDVAHQWMSIMQCFAGAPEEPPAPGTRFTAGQ